MRALSLRVFVALVLSAIVIFFIAIACFTHFSFFESSETELALQQALIVKQRNVEPIGSVSWLAWSKKIAKYDPDVAIELVEFYLSEYDEKNRKFINGSSKNNAKKWLNQIKLLSGDSQLITLANKYYRADKNKLALLVAEYVAPNNSDKLILQHSIAFDSNTSENIEHSVSSTDLANLQRSVEGVHFLNLLSRYNVKLTGSQESLSLENELANRQCPVNVTLFATRIIDIKHAELISSQLSTHTLGNFICVTAIQYKPLAQLNCKAKADQAIQCDELFLHVEAERVKSKYVAIMLPNGKANVHYGALYFDINDSTNIIAHELTHLLGFVDEYPLRKAHRTCQQNQKAPFAQNIAVLSDILLHQVDHKDQQVDREYLRQKVIMQLPWARFISDSTPILTWKNNGWQLGTPESHQDEVGLFFAETCDKSATTAFKPVYDFTSLRTSDSEFPAFYLDLLAEDVDKFLMPSFHYNVALALYKKGEVEQAKQWLEISASWENDADRKKKVLKGQF